MIQKLYNTHEGKSSHFSKPRTSRSAFCVHHYANVVEYESEGFVEKNTDSLVNEHLKLLKASKVMEGMEWEEGTRVGGLGKRLDMEDVMMACHQWYACVEGMSVVVMWW